MLATIDDAEIEALRPEVAALKRELQMGRMTN
jgi:hypothetical protein